MMVKMTLISIVATGVDWGEQGSSGASKVELGVSFVDLGFAPGSAVAVSMYTVSKQGSSIDDGTAEIQWTPANALGWVLILIIIVAASIIMTQITRSKKKQEKL